MSGQAPGTALTVAPPTEVAPRDPGVDLEPPRSLTTLRLHVADRLVEAALNAVAMACGFATTTAAGSKAAFVVTDRVGTSDGRSTILLIDPTPAQARAAVTAVVEGQACLVLSTSLIEHLADVLWAVRSGLALIPEEVLQMAREAPVVTDRQGCILRDLASGLSNKQIATRKCVSVATVKRDLAILFGLFACSNRTELVSRAVTLGYVCANR